MATNGEKIEGIIEGVSEYGIKVNGEWCNPHGRCKDYMQGAVKGATVELTMNGHKNDFTFIRVTKPADGSHGAQKTPSEARTAPIGTQTGYWEEKAERDKLKDVQISRHGAINTAVNILGEAPKAESKAMFQYMMAATNLADLVLRYVQGDDDLQSDLIDYYSGNKNIGDDKKIPEEEVQ